MSESADLRLKLTAALAIASELEKQLTDKETLLTETKRTLQNIQGQAAQLVQQINSTDNTSESNSGSNVSETDSTPDSSSNNDAIRSMPTCDSIVTQFRLTADIYADLYEYFREVEHEGWYWKLIDGSLLSHERAYTLAVAMHADAGIQFDEETCLETPYSPWAPE
ncbi:hypothetical protein BC629DRAFT_1057015 [Irpex lacteus]|nr:hypothetical protein BC629DRAFT_1057015 [Irpex lacteus]